MLHFNPISLGSHHLGNPISCPLSLSSPASRRLPAPYTPRFPPCPSLVPDITATVVTDYFTESCQATCRKISLWTFWQYLQCLCKCFQRFWTSICLHCFTYLKKTLLCFLILDMSLTLEACWCFIAAKER